MSVSRENYADVKTDQEAPQAEEPRWQAPQA